MADRNVELLQTLMCTNTPDGYESSYASFLLTKVIGIGNKKIIETLFRDFPATVLSATVALGETQVALLLRDIWFMTLDDILWLTRRDVKDSLSPRVKQTFSSVAVCCP
ncbi:hypothetical protein RRG08_036968 [Elysia crispata]|uniref:Uncharacterized protein n=1 Tax=Elysia crispata TaxID=231223 RepID=A0AAE0XTN3_9GAST|nr:hypothetical protein RRG08_036968 [Elysia crispata]